MKIQLFWFLTTTSLVFAGLNRRAAQPLYERIQRRGDAYNECVLSHIEQGTHSAIIAVPTAEECIKRFENSIEESCLALYTDQEPAARTQNMNSCFNEQASECKKCMEEGEISPEDQSTVLGLLVDIREKISNSDPEVGCADDL
ncbi:hypothetical protein BDV24DRAFT_165397 [Aspergillus arachidicola]|uniref:Uncharacterized protein n=1 Tax=Aspergillus arachidicola TaxID=656916 RepID=A0A5N6Y1W4_9EURO|nr:hypothetical protein BDV24DRAFT_165397 [Aspergillus arachidicola]